MIKYFAIYLIFISQFGSVTLHEYYVGLTEITYSPEKKRIEIISRLFHDDFEKVLKTRYNENIELKPSIQSENVEDFIKLYFKKKLTLAHDNEAFKIEYLGYKFDDDRINVFLKVENVEDFKILKIQNLLLTDLFEEQKNIVHCFKPKQKKSVLLTRFDAEAVLKFN